MRRRMRACTVALMPYTKANRLTGTAVASCLFTTANNRDRYRNVAVRSGDRRGKAPESLGDSADVFP